jgi:exonuclease SbcD
MKFLHAADLHIDSSMRGFTDRGGVSADVPSNPTRAAFVRLVDLAIAERVAALILAGDVFDGDWEDFHTGVFFVRELQRLAPHGVRVFVARGNHDAANVMTHRMRLPPHVTEFRSDAPHTVVIEEAGLAIHGWSFDERSVTRNVARTFPPPVAGLLNVGVLHTNLDGAFGHDNYAPCTTQDLAAAGYAYWALGHVHQRRAIEVDGCWIVYPGNLQGRFAREADPQGKGATLVEVRDGRIVSVQHRALDVVRWVHVEVESPADHDLLQDTMVARVNQAASAALAGPAKVALVRVTLTGPSPLHADWAHRAHDVEHGVSSRLAAGVHLERIVSALAPAPDADAAEAALAGIAAVAERLRQDPVARTQMLKALLDGPQKILGDVPARTLAALGIATPSPDDDAAVGALVEAAVQRLAGRLRPQTPSSRS